MVTRRREGGRRRKMKISLLSSPHRVIFLTSLRFLFVFLDPCIYENRILMYHERGAQVRAKA